MRRTRDIFLAIPVLLLACAPGPKDTAGTGDSSDASTAGSGMTGTDGASSTGVSTGASATDSATGVTTSAGGSTVTTTPGTTTADPTTTDPSTSGDGTTVDVSTTGSDTGGADLCGPAPIGDPCQTDADCSLAGDCCSCLAFNPSFGSPGNCGGNCKQDRCEEWGFTEGACEAGVCVVKGKSCNVDSVTCNDIQPACPADTLPQVVDGCYTGACLPLAACDWVPDCALCGAGTVCTITEGPDCRHRRCVEAIAECEGSPLCDCLFHVFCWEPHDQCSEVDGALVCSL